MQTKEMQGKLWSIAPQDWSKHFEPYFLPVYKKVLEQITINSDSMLLDAGCGSGLFSHMAAAAGAEVIGVDAAPGLLEVARRRSPGITFMEEELEELPFADESFDIVVGFNSFQYAGSFKSALVEAKRVLKPGGKLVICIWDKPELSDGSQILKAVGSLLPPPPPGTPGPFALSEDGKVENICDSIQLNMLYRTSVVCPFLYRSTGDAVRSFMGTGPAAMALNFAEKNVVENSLAKAFQAYALPDNLYYLQNQFLVFIAEK